MLPEKKKVKIKEDKDTGKHTAYIPDGGTRSLKNSLSEKKAQLFLCSRSSKMFFSQKKGRRSKFIPFLLFLFAYQILFR
jgi:hypothetical protein